MYGLQLACTLVRVRASQRRVRFVGAARRASLPGNRVIYLTQTEPAELNTQKNIHADTRQNNNTHTFIFYILRFLSFSN